MQSDINSLVTQNSLTLSPTLAVHTCGQMSAANRPDVCFLEAGAPAEEPTHTLLAEHTNSTGGNRTHNLFAAGRHTTAVRSQT